MGMGCGRGSHRFSRRWLVAVVILAVALSSISDAKKSKSNKSNQKKKTKATKKGPEDRCSLYSAVALSADALALPSEVRNELTSADAQTLFMLASTACEKQQNEKCFVGFNLFREKFPNLVEGYSNAGVALERLGRLDDAKFLYRVALKKFPEADKAIGPLLNVLQMEAVKAYDEKNYKVALSRYNEIVKLAPHIPDAFINLGNINEALQKYDAAADAYKETMEREPNNVKGYNAMCRLLLMEVSGVAVGRFGVSRARRLEAFNEAKRYCMEAVQVDVDDKGANMNLGMLYKESLEFDLSIKHLRKALDVDKSDTIVLTNLATTLSRNNEVPAAVKFIEDIIEINDSPAAHFSIGTVTAPHDRLSKKALREHGIGQDLAVARGPLIPAGAKCSHSLPHRKLVRSWLSANSVEVDIIEMVDEHEHFGTPDGPRTLNNITLANTKIQAVPLSFIDKQTIALTLTDVSMEGASGIMYTDCEVYLTIGLSTDIPRDYSGANQEVITINTPVVSVTHPSIGNYYHFTAEVATRMLLSLDYYFGENGVAKDATLLLPARYESNLPWEFLDMLGIKLKHEPIAYEAGIGKRYLFKKLHRIDWVQLNTEDPDNNDMWSEYLPSTIALTTLQAKARQHQAERAPADKSRSAPVVYICRAGVREITHEEILLRMLTQLLGDNLFVHDTAGRTGSATVGTLQSQLDLFEGAQIIMGAHGAGLINMVYAADNATVIEFPMTPQCNRCFGYVAMALGIDYWIVPEVSTFYHLKYEMSKKKAKATLITLRAVLKEKGLVDLMSPTFDWTFGAKANAKVSKKDEL